MRDYRHKIDFLQRVPEQNEYGETLDKLDKWGNFKTGIWASKEPLLGREFFSALSIDNKVDVKFNIRYIEGITSEMRIKHGTEIYEIVGPPINVKSLNRELLCYCRQVK